MTRDYSAIHHAALNKSKFRKLSPRGRGCLLTIWLLAGVCQPVVAIWRSRAELLDLLVLDGFTDADLVEVEGLHWLDTLPDGQVNVHDWTDWQRAAGKDGWLEYEAARKRAAYQPAEPLSPAPLSPRENGDETETKGKTVGELRTPPEVSGETGNVVREATPSPNVEPTPICPIHDAPMKRSKGGGWFCSKKLQDGSYCKHNSVKDAPDAATTSAKITADVESRRAQRAAWEAAAAAAPPFVPKPWHEVVAPKGPINRSAEIKAKQGAGRKVDRETRLEHPENRLPASPAASLLGLVRMAPQ